MEQVDGIKIGDWVTTCYAGYWQVVDIKPAYFYKKFTNMLFVIKKGFTPKMKFSVILKYCATTWCNKVSDEKLREIQKYFASNQDKKQIFDTYDKPVIGECMSWTVNLTEDMAKEFSSSLKELPEYFTIGQFNRYVEKIGLRKYMKGAASQGRYRLWIKTYSWLVDKDLNGLFFAPEIISK